MKYSLGKEEKLRHKRLVDGVFEAGTTIYEYPLRLTYRVLDEEKLEESFQNGIPEKIGTLQMLITVPKKKLRHAVDRVRMRRLIREAYRLNRIDLKSKAEKGTDIRTVSMAFIYLHGEKTDYATIEKKLKKLLKSLSDRLEDKGNGDEN